MGKKQMLNVKDLKAHHINAHKRTLGEKATDKLTKHMGSWKFIILFIIFLALWALFNGFLLIEYEFGEPWDPFPFILLNLVLSSIAAIQAPIILMFQNRQAQKDRLRTEYDYAVDRKAEHEIEEIKKQLDRIEERISNI